MVVGDSPLVKSEGRAQSNKVGRLWFWVPVLVSVFLKAALDTRNWEGMAYWGSNPRKFT